MIIFFSCGKKDDCVEIEEKREINGEYYFYFRGSIGGVGGTNEDGFSEDRWGSGKYQKKSMIYMKLEMNIAIN